MVLTFFCYGNALIVWPIARVGCKRLTNFLSYDKFADHIKWDDKNWEWSGNTTITHWGATHHNIELQTKKQTPGKQVAQMEQTNTHNVSKK